ncbi:TPA: hypothetical protein ACMDRZ_003160 [Vibrio cholerae]|uniref:hypothetical protein n=1 Tax=Vibrio cholerae TaxID=666 RepID=UPI001582666E|nr:hypothetical protein [Vibrio cholerae]EJL6310940.1 hypothetical protein [Vibrio cholerae]EJL6419585.1 hypothetical protein [Vibrio cholerae]EJL6582340.1 hypothetical protein [Vibrio cholerae]EKF9842510.1 hypothetical protein [Vibrio cholerae]QKU65555.1 hypothetical protein HPY17_19740 [Vibrio cholerae]
MNDEDLKVRGSVRIALAIESFGYALLISSSMLACAISDRLPFKFLFIWMFMLFLLITVFASKRMKKEAEHYGLYIPQKE